MKKYCGSKIAPFLTHVFTESIIETVLWEHVLFRAISFKKKFGKSIMTLKCWIANIERQKYHTLSLKKGMFESILSFWKLVWWFVFNSFALKGKDAWTDAFFVSLKNTCHV
jgi:hypothetical protein